MYDAGEGWRAGGLTVELLAQRASFSVMAYDVDRRQTQRQRSSVLPPFLLVILFLLFPSALGVMAGGRAGGH